MNLSVGIIGLPNVGKSTLFKALTKKQVNISNYPFCTIDKNVGVVKVIDERLNKLSAALKPKKLLPIYIEFVDIAGLVKGAHQGEGLGNKFLSHIRETDALIEVVRSFSDPDVSHVSGKIDPDSDIETIKLELIFADLSLIEKKLIKAKKEIKTGNEQSLKFYEVLKKIKKQLEKARPIRNIELNQKEKNLVSELNLLTAKPIIYVINVDESSIKNHQSSITDHIYLCAKLEAELADLPEQEAREYLKEYGQNRSALDNLIISSYQLLNLITFFTFQNRILQAWTIKSKSTALESANKIHTDMAKGFIKAEVINWLDLIDNKSEQKAREKGLIRTEGKNYVIQDGDVVRFRFK